MVDSEGGRSTVAHALGGRVDRIVELGLQMQGQVGVVTGATSGIGLETAVALAETGAHVVLTARNEVRGDQAVAAIRARVPEASLEVALLDLGDLSNVRHVGDDLARRHARISVLVNNAGVFEGQRSETVDGFERTIGVNHLGPFLFTRLLMPSLLSGPVSRVVNVSSEAHRASDGLRLDDLHWSARRYSGFGAYADSKLANLLFTRSLSKKHDPELLVAHGVHPGAVATGLFRDDLPFWMRWGVQLARPFLRSPRVGAATSVYVATEPSVGDMTGGYFADCRVKTPTRAGRDDRLAEALWSLSSELVELEA